MAKKSTTKREPVRPKPLTPKAGLKKERYENGGIDINGIVDDVINKLSTVDPFTIDLMSITKLEIGGGKVKIGIPLSDKAISLDEKDLLSFKEGISNIV